MVNFIERSCLALGFAFASSSYAHDPAVHAEITAAAFDYYLEHCAANPEKMRQLARAMDIRGAAMAGSVAEDDKTVSRVLNWHFYRPDKPLRYGPSPVDLDPEDRLSGALEKMASARTAKEPETLYEALGGYLHHIHDVASPAHVVPIMHGGAIKDGFDSYPVDHKVLLATLSGNFCSQPIGALDPAKQLRKLLDDAYRQTQDVLDMKEIWVDVNGERKRVGLRVLWPKCEAEKPGTAHYTGGWPFCAYHHAEYGNGFGPAKLLSCVPPSIRDAERSLDANLGRPAACTPLRGGAERKRVQIDQRSLVEVHLELVSIAFVKSVHAFQFAERWYESSMEGR